MLFLLSIGMVGERKVLSMGDVMADGATVHKIEHPYPVRPERSEARPVRRAPYRMTVFTLGVCGPWERRVDSCGGASHALVFFDRVVRPQPVAGTSGSAA